MRKRMSSGGYQPCRLRIRQHKSRLNGWLVYDRHASRFCFGSTSATPFIGDSCTIFAFVTPQNSPEIQQKNRGAFVAQFCACSRSALCHSTIRRKARQVCNANAAKIVCYCSRNGVFMPFSMCFLRPTAYILHPNCIYISTQLHIYCAPTAYILPPDPCQATLQVHSQAPE